MTFATRASVVFLWSSNYGKNWDQETSDSAKTIEMADTANRIQLEHDTQIMYFRGFFSGGPVTNRGFPLLGVAPHAVVPFLNPANASQQVQFGCDPGSPQFLQNITQCYLPVGGFTLWEFQNEVRADISGPLSASVFCDMGDVSPRPNDFRFRYLHLSCGVGAAYDTPVGPIRVNLGYRVQPAQVLGFKDESDAANPNVKSSYDGSPGSPVNGVQPRIFGQPIAIAIGIGQAF